MALTVEERPASHVPAPAITVASLARDWGSSDPARIAMREKDFGIWQEYSWARTWDLVMDAAHGLLALGIEVGDRVSTQSGDRPEWVILDLATVAVRGIKVGFYPTNPAAEVEYLLTDCGATVHLTEDQEQVDRVLEIDPAMESELLLLDEPVAGMNLEETEDMARFVLDICKELGISILLVEHDMGLVMDIADRVLVLDFGQRISEGVPAEIQKDPAVIAAYLGDEAGLAAAGS